MKYLLILFFCVSFLSCTKFIDVPQNIDYSISVSDANNIIALRDITLTGKDSVSVFFNCTLISGDPSNEYITLKFSGLPKHMTATNDSIMFRPNFQGAAIIKCDSVVPGTYPVDISFITVSKGTLHYTFNVSVTDSPECTSELLNSNLGSSKTYSVSSSDFTRKVTYSCSVTRAMFNEIYINSLGSGGGIFASIDCNARTLRIYPQKIDLPGGYDSLKGSGYYVPTSATTATIYIRDTFYNGSEIKDTCNIIMN